MRKIYCLIFIISLIPIISFAENGMGPGPGVKSYVASGGTGSLIPGNPGFESAIAGSENYGNWWPTADHTSSGGTDLEERLLSSALTGSYVGHIKAQAATINGPCTGLTCGDGKPCGDSSSCTSDCYDDWDSGCSVQSTWTSGTDLVDAGLVTKISKASVDSTNGKITFDWRITGTYYSSESYYFTIQAYDSTNASITKCNTGQCAVELAGTFGNTGDDVSVKQGSPSSGVTYSVTGYDVKGRLVTLMSTGKTWSNVSYIKITPYVNSNTSGNSVELYIDNFR